MKTHALVRFRTFVLLLVFAACSGGGGGTGPNQPPVAATGGPYSTSTGTITFDGSRSSDADGDALTYRWDFGDGKTGEGVAPSHTYTAVGTFTVSLVVKDAKGATSPTASTSAQVTNAAPAITGSDGSVPTGAPYALSITFKDSMSNGPPWAYSIDWGDGNTSTGSKTALTPITGTHTYAGEATYLVKISVTDHGGAVGRDSITVTAGDPVILAAGDIAQCTNADGTNHVTDDSTAKILDGLAGVVMPLGDNAYENGTPTEFANCYGPTWGRQKSRTYPVPGNHDYYNLVPGIPPGTTTNADGYFGYFGGAAGDPTKGYYDFTLGSWLVIVINTGKDSPSYYAAGSPQEQWLRGELASHTQQCVVAMWHHPRFSTISGRDAPRPEVKPIWDALYQYGVDLVLNGHDHAYQRFAPQTPDGVADARFGIRQIVVGTGGGEGLYSFSTPTIPPGSNVDVRNNDTWGVLKVTLKNGSYDWQFVRAAGGSFNDSGSGTCHGRP